MYSIELNKETIAEYCERIRIARAIPSRVDAVKIIREVIAFGLVEAKNYMDRNWDNLEEVFRKELEEVAGLKDNSGTSAQIFLAPGIRLEIKNAKDIPFEALNEFFASVMNGMGF
ncbi:MAG: hypothetical protein Q7S12_04930 [bacterium]|nr:hypothetical protein [bacterium]